MSILYKLPRPEFCCCCINLRTGAIILGVLEALGSIINAFRTFPMVANPNRLANELQAAGFSPEFIDDVTAVARPFLIYLFVNSLVGLLLAALLLVGAIDRKKKLIAIYLYINLFYVGVAIVLGILSLFVVPVFIIFLGITLAFSLYYLFCINAYYLLLDEESNSTQPPPDYSKSPV